MISITKHSSGCGNIHLVGFRKWLQEPLVHGEQYQHCLIYVTELSRQVRVSLSGALISIHKHMEDYSYRTFFPSIYQKKKKKRKKNFLSIPAPHSHSDWKLCVPFCRLSIVYVWIKCCIFQTGFLTVFFYHLFTLI